MFDKRIFDQDRKSGRIAHASSRYYDYGIVEKPCMLLSSLSQISLALAKFSFISFLNRDISSSYGEILKNIFKQIIYLI